MHYSEFHAYTVDRHVMWPSNLIYSHIHIYCICIYKLVADISIDYYSEGKKGYNSKLQDPSEGTWVFDKIETEGILNLIYNTAIEYKANGIMNFSYTPLTKSIIDPGKGMIEIPGIRVTGSAIIIQE